MCPTNPEDMLSRARNYTMAVLAAESGLRANEILHLTVDYLFFDSSKLQTRHAKGKRGSGKRSRTTLFPPLSRDTVRHYLEHCRPRFQNAKESNLLFLSFSGSGISLQYLSKIMREFIKVAQTQNFAVHSHMSWHWFRRIFATRFIERFPHKMPVLLELLGHSNFATVHRYIKHSGAWMDDEIQSIFGKVEVWQYDGN